jgi:hypothetical protein
VLALNETEWGLPGVGGSDAHHLAHIAAAWTNFPGSTAADLRRAITNHETTAELAPRRNAAKVGARSLALGLAWGYTATPRKLLRRRA